MPPSLFELAISVLTVLALLGLSIILRRLARSVVRYFRAVPQSYYGLELKDRLTFEKELRANRIQVITTVVQGLGGMALLIGIYFAWANLKTTQKGQTETLRITNEGQITDRFTKAIAQLGSPQLELRLGGIYALERIAQESEKDHWPIVEILTTYVRVPAPLKTTEVNQSASNGANPSSSNSANPPSPVSIAAPSPDIQAILTVIGRRDRNYEEGKDEYWT